MTIRKISGLRWVRQGECPWPKGRPRGVKLAGLHFQREICEALRLRQEVWFQFEDRNGLGWASPDGLGLLGGRVLVAECKLSQTEDAIRQLEGLYRPLCEEFFGKQVVTLAICKVLRREPWPGPRVRTLEEIAALRASGPPALWHAPWAGDTVGRLQRSAQR